MNTKYTVVIAGATGLVGQTMMEILAERKFPVGELRLLASKRSAGQKRVFKGQEIEVQEISEEAFSGADIALFALKSDLAETWIPVAQKHTRIVIDNSSYYRLDDDVPLVVPEVNPDDIFSYGSNLVANPNCSTIQMVVALNPLHKAYTLRRIIVSTYQAVSGAGKKGVDQLHNELAGIETTEKAFPATITKSPLPHVASFGEDGYTTEERKMVMETRKILHASDIHVSPTCVRVAVENCHSESVNAEFEQNAEPEAARELLRAAPGVVVLDDPAATLYPLVETANGKDDVFVGRIRKDYSVPNGLALWVVADNLRKGAATNAIQIAEVWATRNA